MRRGGSLSRVLNLWSTGCEFDSQPDTCSNPRQVIYTSVLLSSNSIICYWHNTQCNRCGLTVLAGGWLRATDTEITATQWATSHMNDYSSFINSNGKSASLGLSDTSIWQHSTSCAPCQQDRMRDHSIDAVLQTATQCFSQDDIAEAHTIHDTWRACQSYCWLVVSLTAAELNNHSSRLTHSINYTQWISTTADHSSTYMYTFYRYKRFIQSNTLLKFHSIHVNHSYLLKFFNHYFATNSVFKNNYIISNNYSYEPWQCIDIHNLRNTDNAQTDSLVFTIFNSTEGKSHLINSSIIMVQFCPELYIFDQQSVHNHDWQ